MEIEPSNPHLCISPAIPHPRPVTKWSDQSEHQSSPGTAENSQGCCSGFKSFEENSHTQHLLDIVWTSDLDLGFPAGSDGKESACNARVLGSISGLGISPGEGKGYPLQYSGLENSMDGIVHGVAKSWTRLSDFHFHFFRLHCVPFNWWHIL